MPAACGARRRRRTRPAAAPRGLARSIGARPGSAARATGSRRSSACRSACSPRAPWSSTIRCAAHRHDDARRRPAGVARRRAGRAARRPRRRMAQRVAADRGMAAHRHRARHRGASAGPQRRAGAADAAEREGVPGAQPRAEVADALLDSVVLTVSNGSRRSRSACARCRHSPGSASCPRDRTSPSTSPGGGSGSRRLRIGVCRAARPGLTVR